MGKCLKSYIVIGYLALLHPQENDNRFTLWKESLGDSKGQGMISGVSHKICSLRREIPNSLVLFDSKKIDIQAHESWVGTCKIYFWRNWQAQKKIFTNTKSWGCFQRNRLVKSSHTRQCEASCLHWTANKLLKPNPETWRGSFSWKPLIWKTLPTSNEIK